jgi:hypothetical protein
MMQKQETTNHLAAVGRGFVATETETDYHQLSQECIATAERIADPDLRASYLRLAMSYARLARFHERVNPTHDASAGVGKLPTD